MGEPSSSAEPARRISVLAVLIPVLLALVSIGLMLALVPLATCTGCLGLGTITWAEYLDSMEPESARKAMGINPQLTRDQVISKCTQCGRRGRLPLARVWLNPPILDLYVLEGGELEPVGEARLRQIVRGRREGPRGTGERP